MNMSLEWVWVSRRGFSWNSSCVFHTNTWNDSSSIVVVGWIEEEEEEEYRPSITSKENENVCKSSVAPKQWIVYRWKGRNMRTIYTLLGSRFTQNDSIYSFTLGARKTSSYILTCYPPPPIVPNWRVFVYGSSSSRKIIKPFSLFSLSLSSWCARTAPTCTPKVCPKK